MKNLYALVVMALLGSSSIAQQNNSVETKAEINPHAHHADHGNFERATPFWTEDFANGFPSDWVIIDSSGICPWTYSMDGSWGYWSNTGETSADPPIASTTAANGFLICDPDSANHFNYGQPSGTTYQYLASYFGTSAIDCSGHSSVILSFEHNYRYNNGIPMWVQVSTDSVNWTAFDVSGGLANNTESPDPDLEVLNLSTIAANQSTVYLRFGWSARVYYWMLDDINLSEADPNDVSMESGYWGTGIYQNQYFKIPTSQWSPLTFYGGLSNNTGVAMTDVYFDVDVNSGSWTGTSNLISLAPTQLDTTTSTTDWTPSATGTYTVDFTANVTGQTDGNLANNTSSSEVEMTNSVYGLDNLPPDLSGSTGGISNWSGNTGSSFGVGNYFEVIADAEVECIEIGLTSDAGNEGEIIFGAVYFWDGSQWTWLGQTSDYIVQNADLGSLVSITLDQPIAVQAGMEICVVAAHYGGNDAQFMMAQTVPNQMVWGYDVSQTWYWLSNPRAVVVRADFDCVSVGTEELTSSTSIACYPNPATDIVNVKVELAENAEVTVSVFDINGKLVHFGSPQEFVSGEHLIQLNTEAYQAGTYTVEVLINETKTRQLIVIE